ncbi:MAG TPA: DNA polymerase Y family protein [Acidimicrobiales bacterium]|jgi:protein ImuB|nr:DNA polymerase Y family protein [Acidimicrobiales bacterium]
MAVRTMVVWCLDWPVVAHGTGPDAPAAVLHANRVVACTPAARAMGVYRGLRRREAQGRCPDLIVLERDEAREARLFEPVVAAVEAFAPRIEITRPGSCAVPTRGPARYFGGDASLAEQVGARVATVLEGRTECRIGIADGPFAAALAARSAQAARTGMQVVAPGEAAAFLAPMPISVLDQPELVDVLARLGLRTLGRFAAVPAADVVGRFGIEGAAAHRLAAGLDERPPDARQPPPDLRVERHLDPPVERIEQVAFTARELADELHAALDQRGLACTRVAVEAETEHGELLVRLWRHEGVLSAGALADRTRWQLEGWLQASAAARPSGGLVRLALAPDEVVAAAGRQLGFWGGEAAADERAARALARVQGLLGADAVWVPEWRGGRGPADQLRLVPAAAVDLAGRGVGPRAGAPPWPGRLPAPSPAVVHPVPVPAVVTDAAGEPVAVSGRGLLTGGPATVQVGSGGAARVVAWAGPWAVEERWWDHASQRRLARLQVCTDDGVARLLVLEAGTWRVEATYD